MNIDKLKQRGLALVGIGVVGCVSDSSDNKAISDEERYATESVANSSLDSLHELDKSISKLRAVSGDFSLPGIVSLTHNPRNATGQVHIAIYQINVTFPRHRPFSRPPSMLIW